MPKPRRPWTTEEQAQAEEWHRLGMPYTMIARALGRDRRVVTQHLDPRVRAKDLEKGRAYYARNRGKVQEKNRRIRDADPLKYREIRRRAKVRRRSANLRSLTPMLTGEQMAERFALFGNRCAYCGEREKLTHDHVLALSRGGLDEPLNIVPACRSCNSSKGAQLVEPWYRQQLFFGERRWQKICRHCSGAGRGQMSLAHPLDDATLHQAQRDCS